MDRQLGAQVIRVDVDQAPLAADAACFLRVPVGNAEATALVADEPVEADLALGAEVGNDLRRLVRRRRHGHAAGEVHRLGGAVDAFVVTVVLLMAPAKRLAVELRDVAERARGEEVVLHEAYEALDLSLRERMAGLAELRLEAEGAHERLVVALPDGMALRIALHDDGLHVVGKHVARHAHAAERVNHPDEQVLLAGVGKEFDVAFAAVMADHREAGYLVGGAPWVLHLDEPPVHLEALARACLVAAPSIALGIGELPPGGDEVGMRRDVVLDDGEAAGVALFAQSLEANGGVGDALAQKVVDDARETAHHRLLGLQAAAPVRHHLEAFFLERSGLAPRETGPSRELGNVHLVQFESFAELLAHLVQNPVHDLLKVVCLRIFYQ